MPLSIQIFGHLQKFVACHAGRCCSLFRPSAQSEGKKHENERWNRAELLLRWIIVSSETFRLKVAFWIDWNELDSFVGFAEAKCIQDDAEMSV